MADKRKINRKMIGILLAIALAGAFIYCASVGLFAENEIGKICVFLADGFTLPGVLFICIAGLIFAKRRGVFDGLSYSARYTLGILMPSFWLSKGEAGGKMMPYRIYCERKREKEKQVDSMALEFLLVGCVFLFVAIIFNVIVACAFPNTVIA